MQNYKVYIQTEGGELTCLGTAMKITTQAIRPDVHTIMFGEDRLPLDRSEPCMVTLEVCYDTSTGQPYPWDTEEKAIPEKQRVIRIEDEDEGE